LTRRILRRTLQLHANALGRRAGDWREVSRVSEEVGGDENRRPFIPEPDDDDALYSRPPPKKSIQKKKSRKSPKLGARSIAIPTTAADRDREAAPAIGNGSDHESDWNEVEDTDGLELMSRKEAQKKALKNIKKPVSTPNASVALHADC
jgi:hypothetical protein